MPSRRLGPLLLSLGAALAARDALAQAGQRADADFVPRIEAPAHPAGKGPLVCQDHGHHNFHRIDGRFAPFAELLRRDGYAVRSIDADFGQSVPSRCRILVIANAQPGDEEWDDYPYPTPSAFTNREIRTLVDWVKRGGRLLLIADHMPLAGAAASLAAAFGVEFNDGFAVAGFRTEAEARANFMQPVCFTAAGGSLRAHPVTSVALPGGRIDHVCTFSGQAFQAGPDARPLLVLPAGFLSLMPEKAWRFTPQTARVPVGGWLQGATLLPGRGRLAVFGEAAMFTAQITEDGRRMGMNATEADQNASFVRNVVAWLAAD